ncbi:MAG: DUF1896 family protein [Rikenellaceae bacterium]
MEYQANPLSVFFLKLLEHLTVSYPHLAKDFGFIADRDELAACVFQAERQGGATYDEAMAKADEVLFMDLHFSLHELIQEVLSVEYGDVVPEHMLTEVAISLYDDIEPLLEKYQITPEFSTTPEYNALYTEVTGKINEIFDHYGI